MFKACKVCKHAYGLHMHYRDGTDCGFRGCKCKRYIGQWIDLFKFWKKIA